MEAEITQLQALIVDLVVTKGNAAAAASEAAGVAAGLARPAPEPEASSSSDEVSDVRPGFMPGGSQATVLWRLHVRTPHKTWTLSMADGCDSVSWPEHLHCVAHTRLSSTTGNLSLVNPVF